MDRTVLTDGTGRWFDAEAAQRFKEATRWNGQNNISRATGSQWEHQALYRTAGGRWILNAWSNWQGSLETWEEIDNEQAARWLAENEHEPHQACAEEYAALEIP